MNNRDDNYFANEVGRSLDEAAETLRWCRLHIQDRGVTSRLHELEITLGALALAIDYEMDGNMRKATQALDQADWQIRPPQWYQWQNDMFNLHFEH
jgi:hypothetical protein